MLIKRSFAKNTKCNVKITARIIEILSKGYIEDYNIKESIKKTLLSSKGSSIINFSNFVDEIIDNW